MFSIYFLKIKTAIFDFYSSVRLGRKGNLYQGGKQWPKGKRREGRGWGKRNYPTPLPTLPTLTLAGQKTDCELVMLTCPSKMPPLQATQRITLTTLGTNLHESLMLLLYFFLQLFCLKQKSDLTVCISSGYSLHLLV